MDGRSSRDGGTRHEVEASGQCVGIEALYIPISGNNNANGLEELRNFQYQWMRIHPASVLVPDDDDDTYQTIFPQVHTKPSHQNGTQMIDKKQQPIEVRFETGIQLPLSSFLGDPPLMSEWVPGTETNISYDSCSSSDPDEEDEVQIIVDAKESELLSSLPTILSTLKEVANILQQRSGGTSYLDALEDFSPSKREVLLGLGRCSASTLLQTLSSATIVELIIDSTRNESDGSDGGKKFRQLSVGIAILYCLATYSSSKAMGQHIYSNIGPTILGMQGTDSAYSKSLHQGAIQELTHALIDYCELWKLSKSEMHALQTRSLADSEACCEFRSCVAETYFSVRQAHGV